MSSEHCVRTLPRRSFLLLLLCRFPCVAVSWEPTTAWRESVPRAPSGAGSDEVLRRSRPGRPMHPRARFVAASDQTRRYDRHLPELLLLGARHCIRKCVTNHEHERTTSLSLCVLREGVGGVTRGPEPPAPPSAARAAGAACGRRPPRGRPWRWAPRPATRSRLLSGRPAVSDFSEGSGEGSDLCELRAKPVHS